MNATRTLRIESLLPSNRNSGATTQAYFDPESFRVYSHTAVGNSSPMRAFLGLDISLGRVPTDAATTEGLEALLEAHKESLAFVASCHTTGWDGSNHRGKTSEAGLEVLEQLQDAWLEEVERVSTYWEASDWFEPCSGEVLDEILAADSLESWVNTAIDFAASEGVFLEALDVRIYGLDLLEKTVRWHDEDDAEDAAQAAACQAILDLEA